MFTFRGIYNKNITSLNDTHTLAAIMRNKIYILLSFIFLFIVSIVFVSFSKQEEPLNFSSEEINQGWQFKSIDDKEWMSAKVPSSVHTDLIMNNKIDDPFYRLNEHDVQWVDKKDWEYKTIFKIASETLSKDKVELLFEGLDTYAEVYVNNNKVLFANNMFREWRIDCKEFLKIGDNELRIVLLSPIKIGIQKQDSLGYTMPPPPNDLSEIGGIGDKKVGLFTRKAGYHFGWDWGPRLVTSGIWKPIKLQSWNKAMINNLYVQQNELTKSTAKLMAYVEIEALEDFDANMKVIVNNGEIELNKPCNIKTGKNTVTIPIVIENPKIWWPNGIGEHPLYTIDVAMDRLSNASTKIGLRTVEVVREKDSVGSSFYFKVNNNPVFMKGANYIPQDVFLDRVTPDHYKHIIETAVSSNMNMLRVWGGGIYENDIFYDLCDENGILVWQDFMFGCSMFPGEEEFLDNVKREAIDNVKRLRNHPSIAMWCGNNENLVAWHNWGWKKKVEEEQGKEIADKIWKAYDDNFHKILPMVVSEYDSNRFYWSSSPSADFGVVENWENGDVHYWDVWWGQKPFSNYRTKIGRFMSEYGFQSFPELSSIKKYAIEEDWDIFSDVMKSHQRSSIGNGTIENYMKRDYNTPKDFAMFLYVGQLLQAEGIKIAMESHRKKMPFCMGSLYWQINDCWPVASWSSMDYYGKWKAQQYFTKQALNNILVSPEITDSIMKVFVVSDELKDLNAKINLEMLTFEGKKNWEHSEKITIKANISEVYFEISKKELLNAAKENNLLLHTSVIEGDKILSENILYFLPPKDLMLTKPMINLSIDKQGTEYKLTITTDKLAKNVYLTTEVEGFFSDNFFDLLPGKTKVISFTPKSESNEEIIEVNIISLVDSY